MCCNEISSNITYDLHKSIATAIPVSEHSLCIYKCVNGNIHICNVAGGIALVYNSCPYLRINE